MMASMSLVALLAVVLALAIWVALHTDASGKQFDTEWRGQLHEMLKPGYSYQPEGDAPTHDAP